MPGYQIRSFSQMLTLVVIIPMFFPALINKQQLLLKGKIDI